MFSGRVRRIFKYALLGGAAVGTFASLQANQYQINSIGIVRLSRAAITVFKIGVIYRTELYNTNYDKKSEEYQQVKSRCHKRSAEKLLDLCCTNKGVYIKVGQHLATLDYLVPREYVQTMKILHSRAPTNTIEEVFKVIKEDLKREVC